MKNITSYKEYINSLSKQELVDKIVGSEDNPPIITRDEPKYNRVQIIWAINKMKVKKIDLETLDAKDEFVDSIMNTLSGFDWKLFYNYDYIRLDVRKPGFYFFIIMVFALFFLLGFILYILIK